MSPVVQPALPPRELHPLDDAMSADQAVLEHALEALVVRPARVVLLPAEPSAAAVEGVGDGAEHLLDRGEGQSAGRVAEDRELHVEELQAASPEDGLGAGGVSLMTVTRTAEQQLAAVALVEGVQQQLDLLVRAQGTGCDARSLHGFLSAEWLEW